MRKEVQYTPIRRKNGEASRIDYFWVDRDIINMVKSADIRPAQIKCTDHQAISLKLKLIKTKKKRSGCMENK